MKSTTGSQQELVSFLKKEYNGNPSQLSIVREFEEDYSYDKAVWWYTRESFLYKVLNKALRVQKFDLLFIFRFFIRDMDRQIKHHQCSIPIRVYRGQLLSSEALEKLKNSLGEFISMNSFVSASLDRQLALFYIADANFSSNLERVLFDIEADPRLDAVKPFANITSISYFCKEKEVLFTVGAIFQIMDIHPTEDRVWVIRMKLCSDNDGDLKSTLEHMKQQYGCGETSLLSLGRVLEAMGRFDEAEKYFFRLLNELPSGHEDIAHCYHNLGIVAQDKGDFRSSLEWHHKSLEIKMQTLKHDDPSFSESYSSMGCLYDDQGDNSQSLVFYEEALILLKKAFGDNDLKVAECLDSMGLVYNNDKKYSQAIDCHHRALAIMQNQLPTNHHQLGLVHTSIGNLYRNLGEYELALTHYNLSLEICKKSLSCGHPNNAWTLKNIGLLHENMLDLHRALHYYEQAANIYHDALPSTHSAVIKIEQLIEHVLSQINK